MEELKIKDELTKENYIGRIIELESALGMAIGALEVVRLCPYDFNQDGVRMVLERLRACIGTPLGK